jgi:hypothetical protein
MSETWLVNLVIHQLSASCYKYSIETLTAVHTACRTQFHNIDEIVTSLSADDLRHGLSWGGAPSTTSVAPTASITSIAACSKSPHPYVKFDLENQRGLVSSVLQATDDTLTFHPKHPWNGLVDLTPVQVTTLKNAFPCFVCRTMEHRFINCLLLKNFIIECKPDRARSTTTTVPPPTGRLPAAVAASSGGVSSVFFSP